jgi:CDP-paratose 2-epimerase
VPGDAVAGRDSWPQRVMVTGGAGFIGANAARRLLESGREVVVVDNFGRHHSRTNVDELSADFGDGLRVVEADVCDAAALRAAVDGVGAIVHLAGQTAVTRSISDPVRDLWDNCIGTVNVLEAARQSSLSPTVIFASTNKVYGDLADVPTIEEADHYRFADQPAGIAEDQPLRFVSPYACSKGAAEQYVLDYARTYDLSTVVFRQSCIYGPRQLGSEDQGWLAWFLLAARSRRPLTIYGDGKQVRDLLYVDDLVDAFEAALGAIDVARGRAYNIGGGASNCLSVWWQLRPVLEAALGEALPEPEFGPWRLGDQRVYCSDTRRATSELDWAPTTSPADGVTRMVEWFDSLPASALGG